MERYTYFDGGKWRIKIGDTEYSGKAVDRLAAYEETGLEPEEIISAAYTAKIAYVLHELNAYMARIVCALHELNAYKELGPIDRLRELAQADNEGRCVVLDDLTVSDLHQMLTELTAICYGDGEETYTTGYRNGRKNGKIEILRSVLGVHEGASEKAEAALEGMKNG